MASLSIQQLYDTHNVYTNTYILQENGFSNKKMTAKDFMQLIIKQLRVISKESVNKFERIMEQEYKYNNVRLKCVNNNYDDFNVNEIPGINPSNGNNMSLLVSQSPHSHNSHSSHCSQSQLSVSHPSVSITSESDQNIFNFDGCNEDNDNLTLFAEGYIISDFDPNGTNFNNFNLFPPEITANLAVPDSSVVSVQSSPVSIPQIPQISPVSIPQIPQIPPISSYNGYHASSISVQGLISGSNHLTTFD